VAKRKIIMRRKRGNNLEDTLAFVERSIKQGYTHPMVLRLTNSILRDLPDRETLAPNQQDLVEIAELHDWVLRNIRYSTDPYMEETVRDPEAVLLTGQGDCDDLVVLLGALLLASGKRIELWLAGDETMGPQHIYLVAYTIGGQPVAVDATLKQQGVGATSRHPKHWLVEGAFSDLTPRGR